MKFVLLFITLSGNYLVFAQNETKLVDSAAALQHSSEYAKPIKTDPLVMAKAAIRLYPNPTENKVEIKIENFEPGSVDILMLDNIGNIVRKDTRQVFSGNENIIFMFMQKPGIYILMLKQKDRIVKERLIVK